MMNRLRFVRSMLLVWIPLALLVAGVIVHLAEDKIDSRGTLLRESEVRNVARGVEAISHAVDRVVRDVRFLAAHGALRGAVNADGPAAVAALAESFLAFADSQGIYDQIRWIDETGMERVRVELADGRAKVVPADRLQNKARRYFFADTMSVAVGEVYVSPLDLNVERDRIEVPHKPTLRVGTPVFDAAGHPRGIVLVNYYGRELLDAFGRAASTTAERAMLLNRDGHWLKAPDPGDEWGFMFRSADTFGKRHPGALARVRAEESGQFEDDQGIWTFATVHPLVARERSSSGSGQAFAPGSARRDAPEYYWKAVARVSAEQLAAYRAEVWTDYAPALAFLLLLALLASARIAQVLEQRRSADEQLRQSHAELEQKVVERTELLAEREREHLQILEDSPSAIIVLRLADAAFVYGNPASQQLLGVADSSRDAQSIERLFVDPAQGRDVLATLRQSGHIESEVRLHAADGREFDALLAARVTRFASEPAVIASLVDITERKRAEVALADSQQRYRQLFEAESDAILLIENESGRILEANAAAARLYGYTADELRGMFNHQLSAEPEETQRVSRLTPADGGGVVVIPLRLHRRRDGTVIPVELSVRFFELGGLRVHISAIRDIGTRLAAENALRDANARLSQQLADIEVLQASLREQAIRDGLTGLFNRRFLEETCTRELARAQREGYPVALAMFDLDLFKRINDSYGHAAGDEVIIALARLLQKHARSSDTACRFGGEEFVLLLPGVDLATAAERVEDLRRTFADTVVTFGAFRLRTTVSAGIAAYPAHGLSTRDLVARADEALYAAKRAGRNRVEFWADAPGSNRE